MRNVRMTDWNIKVEHTALEMENLVEREIAENYYGYIYQIVGDEYRGE